MQLSIQETNTRREGNGTMTWRRGGRWVAEKRGEGSISVAWTSARILSQFFSPFFDSQTAGVDPRKLIQAAKAFHQVREQTFPYHEETSMAAPPT